MATGPVYPNNDSAQVSPKDLAYSSPVEIAEAALLGTGDDSHRLFVCSIYEDQRPLKGIAGALDWRLKGFLSRFVLGGKISGTRGECVYIPVRHREVVRHLLIVGLGSLTLDADADAKAEAKLLEQLAKIVKNLNFTKVAISRSSFPFFEDAQIKKALKGVEVEFTQ